jgi:heme/copper-type cytochrome/quinol oxidase subunit 2
MNTIFLFSLPGGGEWLMILFTLIFVIVAPVLAIIYYSEAKRLRRENKELLEKLIEKNK